jgi:hypothetical protein
MLGLELPLLYFLFLDLVLLSCRTNKQESIIIIIIIIIIIF